MSNPNDPAPQMPLNNFGRCDACDSLVILVPDGEGGFTPRKIDRKTTRWKALLADTEELSLKLESGQVDDPADELKKLCDKVTGKVDVLG